MNNYYSKFGLTYNPFIKNSKDVTFKSETFVQGMARLNRLIELKGIGIVSGEPGIGKTSLVRNLVKDLNKSLYKVIYIPLSTLTINEFYRDLSIRLGLEPRYKKSDNFRQIQKEILRLVDENKITPIIIVDEANYIKPETLHDLKMLLNFSMDSSDKIVLLLVGLPEINTFITYKVYEALSQRIVMNYNVTELTKDEIKQYILFKLKMANVLIPIINEDCYVLIENYSKGKMRLINKLIDQCLFFAANENSITITKEIVDIALNEVSFGN
ncbi:MAG: AAA family ATPase [Mycoplasmataceae bacterium]|nr:AAA family ATPase [Mycoplasmataceae bacterium]